MTSGKAPSTRRWPWLFAMSSLLSVPAQAQSGWADLHAHPANHLGFGHKPADTKGDLCKADEGIFHGEPGLVFDPADPDFGISEDLRACEAETHSPCTNTNVAQKRVRTLLLNLLETRFGVHTPYGYSDDAAERFMGWPHAGSRTHQQMHLKWLHRAYQGGQRLMIASVTDNELLEKWYHDDHQCEDGVPRTEPGHDFASAVEQIAFLEELIDGGDPDSGAYDPHPWMKIARSAEEAEAIIAEDHMAVILGVELDALRLDELQTLVDEHGVRSVIPIHMVDNEYGGSAVYDDLFNSLNQWKNGDFFKVEADPSLSFRLGRPSRVGESVTLPLAVCPTIPASLDDASYADTRYACLADHPREGCIPDGAGHRNARGLSDGGEAIKELMAMGLLIDVAHMSTYSVDQTLAVAEGLRYPLIDSHTGVRDPTVAGGNERAITIEQARRIAALGGIIGIGTEGDVHPRSIFEAAGAPVVRLTGDAPEWRSYLEPDDASRTTHRMQTLRIRVQTGGDDLRGSGPFGSASRAVLRLNLTAPVGGVSSFTHELNEGAGWAGGSAHEVVWDLTELGGPGAIAPSLLRSARIEFSSGPGYTDGDGWSVDRVQMDYVGRDTSGRPVSGLLFEREGQPYRRLVHGANITMTSSRRSAATRLEAQRDTRLGQLEFTFVTGSDDLMAPGAVVITTYDGRTIERDLRRLDRFAGGFARGETATGNMDLRTGKPIFYGDIASIHVHNREGGPEIDFDNWDLDAVTVRFRACATADCTSLGASTSMVDRQTLELRGSPSFRADKPTPAKLLWSGLGERVLPDEVLRRIGARIRTGADDLRTGSHAQLVLWLSDGSERSFELNQGALWDGGELVTEKTVNNLIVGEPVVRRRDVVAVGLRFQGAGHDVETHDNWNVNLFEVNLESDPVNQWVDAFRVALGAVSKEKQPALALGTDLNGLQPQLPFTELQQTKGLSNLPERFRVDPGDTTLGRTFTLERDGIAHYGMLPDFLDAVAARGGADTSILFDSAGATVRTWRRAEEAAESLRRGRRRVTSTPAAAPEASAAGCQATPGNGSLWGFSTLLALAFLRRNRRHA